MVTFIDNLVLDVGCKGNFNPVIYFDLLCFITVGGSNLRWQLYWGLLQVRYLLCLELMSYTARVQQTVAHILIVRAACI